MTDDEMRMLGGITPPDPEEFPSPEAGAFVDGKIKLGSVVRLKSGGPNMTVTSTLAEDEENSAGVSCCWFERDSNGAWMLKEDIEFAFDQLRLVEE